MCCTFGGLPYFPENDNQVFGDGYPFRGGCPFFQKLVIRDWYRVPIWGGDANTSGYTESRIGTWWVSISNWYHTPEPPPPPPPRLMRSSYTNLVMRYSECNIYWNIFFLFSIINLISPVTCISDVVGNLLIQLIITNILGLIHLVCAH